MWRGHCEKCGWQYANDPNHCPSCHGSLEAEEKPRKHSRERRHKIIAISPELLVNSYLFAPRIDGPAAVLSRIDGWPDEGCIVESVWYSDSQRAFQFLLYHSSWPVLCPGESPEILSPTIHAKYVIISEPPTKPQGSFSLPDTPEARDLVREITASVKPPGFIEISAEEIHQSMMAASEPKQETWRDRPPLL